MADCYKNDHGRNVKATIDELFCKYENITFMAAMLIHLP